jgi:hypothetical protein
MEKGYPAHRREEPGHHIGCIQILEFQRQQNIIVVRNLSPGAILPGVEFRLGHYQTLSPWEK